MKDVLLQAAVTIERKPPANLTSADAELFDDEFTYRTNNVCLKDFGEVWVSPDSVVYKRGHLITETLPDRSYVSYYRWRHLVRQWIRARRVTLANKRKYLLLTDSYSVGHYHWFTEVIPRLLLVGDESAEFVLLLPDHSYMRKIGIESLDRMGCTFQDIVWLDPNQFYKVPNLYFVTRVAGPGQVDDDLMHEVNRRFSSAAPRRSRKLYVSRSRASIRKVLNESEVTGMLEGLGFETVIAEDLSLAEQIGLFGACLTMVGIHGAGLTNCLFMKGGGNVIELRKSEPNYAYWHLAESIGHNYYYYNGNADSDLSLIGRGCNLTVPVGELGELVASVISSKSADKESR